MPEETLTRGDLVKSISEESFLTTMPRMPESEMRTLEPEPRMVTGKFS